MIEKQLIELGYRYNHTNDYLFKTKRVETRGFYIEATAFYENGKFEFYGNPKVVELLKDELEKRGIINANTNEASS